LYTRQFLQSRVRVLTKQRSEKVVIAQYFFYFQGNFVERETQLRSDRSKEGNAEQTTDDHNNNDDDDGSFCSHDNNQCAAVVVFSEAGKRKRISALSCEVLTSMLVGKFFAFLEGVRACVQKISAVLT
jgi:hypothetical protein